MNTQHPHAEATYRVVALDGSAFGVEVVIPDTAPTLVTGLANRQAAENWIVDHKARVTARSTLKRNRFRRP